jgi:beta-lactamase class D
MQAHLDAAGYGNRSMAGGLDRFWLEGGGLAISAVEQVEFLSRLVAGTLPVSARAHEIVRAAMPTETAGDATLHWKTGTAREGDAPWTAWLVGWVDRPDGVHVFACWLADPGDFAAARSHRMEFCKGALARLGVFTPPSPAR